MDKENLPTLAQTGGALANLQAAIANGMAPALAIMLDEQLFAQVEKIAAKMAKAAGFVPAHCVGNTEVCFAIVTRSLVWNLDPFAVAQSTYQPTQGAKVSYEAKLVQAILEQSGRLRGGISREYIGDWSRVRGKFRMSKSDKGKDYPVKNYSDDDEAGLAIKVSATLRGESEPRSVTLSLRQCYPRNSTLWATDPETQAYYRAVRMLGNVALPAVLMGVPFVGEEPADDEATRAERARDVTGKARAGTAPELLEVVGPYGDVLALSPEQLAANLRQWCAEATDAELDELDDANPDIAQVRDAVLGELRRRKAKEPEPEAAATAPVEPVEADPADPLHILGVKGAMGFLSALRLGLEHASIADADRFWYLYRERAAQADAKVNAGDFKSLEALVADKISGRS